MQFLLDELQAQQRGQDSVYALSALQRAYGCQCERVVFFRNTHCLACNTPLGYEPHFGRVLALVPGPEADTWQIADRAVTGHGRNVYRRCANLKSAALCNWLVRTDDTANQQPYCISCRLNRTTPDFAHADNGLLWKKIEDAKRRVISALVALGLTPASRITEDPERGLAFDLLRSPDHGPRVLTGHENGLITINIEEADDAKREQIRASMREPYRTLVGHVRHEVGHYYWDRLIAGSPWLLRYRDLFGDERAHYNEALKRNYEQGPAPNWAERHVSAYASIHPWEDWAETWAHYMHMIDTLGTAMSFGLRPENIGMPFECFGPESLYDSEHPDSERFLSFLNSWLKLTAVMNELCRSMGQPDFYPFALPQAAVTKLHFVHMVVTGASSRYTLPTHAGAN